MPRSRLIAEIRAADQRLAAERRALASQGRARLDYLGRVSPLLLLGGGLLAGLVVGRLVSPAGAGCRAAYLGSIQFWRLAGGAIALLAARP